MNGKPKVLLFDLGGVLVDFIGLDEVRPLLPEPLNDDEMRSRWLRSESVLAFDRGQIDPETFADRFLAEWALRIPREEFVETFSSWVRGFYPGATELLQELKGKYRLACLSNVNELHWGRCGEAVTAAMDVTFASFQLGLAKPDGRVYAAVMAELGVGPDEVCFFDDSRPNVIAARRMGIESDLVRGLRELRATLVQRSLIQPGSGGEKN